MTLFRATVVDAVGSGLTDCRLRVDEDAGLLVTDGIITARGPFAELFRAHPDEPVVRLRDGLLLPGFVETHAHFPQVRAIGGLGLPLLDWLQRYALPEELKLADPEYAAAVAEEFVLGLLRAGTTTVLAFGAHFAPAMDRLFEAATRWGIRLVSGLVVSDRTLPEDLLTTPDQAYADGLRLARRWHGRRRLGYAVTPRFSLSCSEEMLESCAALLTSVEGARFTSHLNENLDEIEGVRRAFGTATYLDTYSRPGLVGAGSVFAHNVHPEAAELDALADAGASVAHCPTSNAMLGSGLFPLRQHLEHGVRVSLGSDVGAGTGFSLLKEGLQAHMTQELRGEDGYPLTAVRLLYLATGAGASALGMDGLIGELGVGRQFDAQWISPQANPTLAMSLRNAESAEDALAKVFTLGTPADVAAVWIGGDLVSERSVA
nr:guanine deaminase [Propionicimonas sp.]